MRRLQFLLIFSVFTIHGFAQIPAGYYSDADGQTGYTLKSTLHGIIDGHTDQGYSALWTLYYTSDVRSDGKVWDMYSDCDFVFGDDQDSGSGGTSECDVYNREHSFPKSWFNDGAPMINDPFHVIPADKKVNGIRGNYAYGEVSAPSYTSLNGSKLGPNTYPGYSGTVFEPADEYKGDLARGYFYMATRYEDVISNWQFNDSDGDAMLDGSSDQVFEDWALDMLLTWHENDPVSQKEIDRNEAIYDYQGNRNPFIDHPEYVSCIWEGSCTGSSSAVLTVSTSSFADFGSIDNGEVSTSKNYILSGTDLEGDVTITAPDYFEVSLDNADFSSSITLIEGTYFSAPTLSSTTVYVRFAPNSGLNGAISGEITNETTGDSKSVSVSGTESGNVAPENELFFSEYIEPNAGNDKALEIFNPTSAPVDLSSYQVKVSHNGLGFGNDGDTYDITLSGTISANDVYVIYNAQAANETILAEGDLALTYGENPGDKVASFTGNDAIGLFKNGVLIDLIGDPISSVDPGWDVAGIPSATADHTLVRKSSVNAGNIDPLGSFGTSAADSEWEVLDANTFSNIGSHDFAQSTEPQLSLSTATLADFGSVSTGNESSSKSYTITGSNLTEGLVITAPTHFQLSKDDVAFSNEISFTTEESNSTNTIFVKFVPTTGIAQSLSGTITHSSNELTEQISVSGTEITGDPIDAEIALTNLEQVYDGTGKSPAVSTTPEGLEYAITYNGSPSIPVNAGTYAVVVEITEGGYQGSTSANFTITRAEATVSLSNTQQSYTGAGVEVTATTSPSNLNVNVLYDGSTELPVDAGSYMVEATIDENNYIGKNTGTLTIAKASAEVMISDLDQVYNVYDGTPRAVTVTTIPEGLTTNVLYGDSSTPPTEPGVYVVFAEIVDNNYFGSALEVFSLVTGLGEVFSVSDGIYPNPVRNMLHVDVSGNYRLSIYSQEGKLVLENQIEGNTRIDVSQLPWGYYTLKLRNNKEAYSVKLFVER